jgi:hypothetical protein
VAPGSGRSRRLSPAAIVTAEAEADGVKLPALFRQTKTRSAAAADFERSLFRIIRLPNIFAGQKLGLLRTLFGDIETTLSQALRQEKLAPLDFGSKDVHDLANRVLAYLANRQVSAESPARFLKSIVGHEHNLNGEAFEWLVLNLRSLHEDLKGWAAYQEAHLNEVIGLGSGNLLDGRGTALQLPKGRFSPSYLATDVWLVNPDGKRVKFVDFFYLSSLVGPEHFFSPTVFGEIKLPSAARRGPRQVAFALPRLANAVEVQMTVGGAVVSAKPEEFVFSQKSINQTLIRPSRESWGVVTGSKPQTFYDPETEVDFRPTRPAGAAFADATFLDVQLLMRASQVTALSKVFFRR